MKITHIYKLLLFVLFFSNILFYCNTNNKDWKKESIQQRKISKTNPTESIKIGKVIISQSKNDSIIAHTYAMLAASYSTTGDFANAFENAYIAKEKLEDNNARIEDIINNNIYLIYIYTQLNLTDRASQELNQSLLYIKKNDKNNFYLIGAIYYCYGNLYTTLKKYDKAIEKRFLALEYFKKVKDPKLTIAKSRFIYQTNSEIANDYLWLNDFKKAEYYLKTAEKSLDPTRDPDPEIYFNKVRFGILYIQTDRNQEAIDILEPLRGNPIIDSNTQVDISMTLAQAYKGVGNMQKYENYKAEADSITMANFNKKSVGMQEIVKKVEDRLVKTERQHYLYVIASIITTVVLLLFIIIAIQNYRNRLKEQKNTYQQLILSITNKKEEKKEKIQTQVGKEIKTETNNEDIVYTKSELQLLEKLEKFENSKAYLKKNMTLAVLAVKLDTNAFYLSDIVNKAKNKNFSSYINELRINYIVKELYDNPVLLSYKISYLADLCGFKSHNTFTLTFKKITNISPSTFIEQRKNEIKNTPLSIS